MATIREILDALHERDSADMTDMKYKLQSDENKASLRRKYEEELGDRPVQEIIDEFKAEVEALHEKRDVQQEQQAEMMGTRSEAEE